MTNQNDFLQLCVDVGALRFGEFKLKSGRISPYFFNAGLFASGKAVAELGRHYARAIIDSRLEFDMLFGPAYKGIPLSTTIAIALADHYQHDVPFAYNRKEAKDHGEGGIIVGAELTGKVLVVDDVISAGTSVRESVTLIEHAGAQLAGVAIALDRQERGLKTQSAAQEVSAQYGAPVLSIANLDALIGFLSADPARDEESNPTLSSVVNYRTRYGVAAG